MAIAVLVVRRLGSNLTKASVIQINEATNWLKAHQAAESLEGVASTNGPENIK